MAGLRLLSHDFICLIPPLCAGLLHRHIPPPAKFVQPVVLNKKKIRALIHKFVRNFSSLLDEERDLMRFTILLPLSNETDSSI